MADSKNVRPVLCRPALPKDTDDVMELTSHIWDGHDYIPYVWLEWLSDTLGLLAVAEMGGRVVGLAKLSRITPDEWFMEGLRVHPNWQAQGIAAQLNGYIMDYWRKNCAGSVRLATHNENVKVHHLCERSGFKRVAEFIPYLASTLSEAPDGFEPVCRDELQALTAFAHASPSLALSAGLVDLGWRWARLDLQHLEHHFDAGLSWWWRGRQGAVVLSLDEEDDESRLQILMAICPLDQMTEFLLDYRRLGARSGKERVGWAAPAHPQIQAALQEAGFERGWDKSLYLYELSK